MKAGRNHGSRFHLSARWSLLIVVVVCGLLLTAVAWWFVRPTTTRSTLSLSADQAELPARAQSFMDIAGITAASYVPPAFQAATETTARQYMTAFLHRQFSSMWSLLNPNMQALWPDESVFAHFWQARFEGYTLQNFTIGAARWLPKWVYPETMKEYDDVLVVPVSLALHPGATITNDSLAPPEDKKPTPLYQNLQLIVQRVGGTNGGSGALVRPRWRPRRPGSPHLAAHSSRVYQR